MISLVPAQISDILSYLESNYNASLVDVVVSAVILDDNPTVLFTNILRTVLDHAAYGPEASGCLLQVAREKYTAQLSTLSSKASGWHFSAIRAKAREIEELEIEPMLQEMKRIAPDLCLLVGDLLSADKGLAARRDKRAMARERKAMKRKERRLQRAARDAVVGTVPHAEDRSMDSDEELWRSVDNVPPRRGVEAAEQNGEELWAQLPDLSAEDLIGDDEEVYWREDFEPHMPEDPTDATSAHDIDRARERRDALLRIKTVISLSIMMQSTNQRCNALQTSIGLFMHACNTAETVIEFLAHTGISISVTAINDSITNLSVESAQKRRRTGQTLRTGYGVDNVDMELKHNVPTAENPESTMVHLTSATMLPLYHGVEEADLKCSDFLWQKTEERILTTGTNLVNPHYTELLNIHPERDIDPPELTRRERFNAWIFLQTLVLHGPDAFRKFQDDLGEPEEIECIPVVKTEQIPAQAMDINPSTAAGNADVLNNVLKQGGVGDPEQEGAPAGIKDIDDHVIIVHGDLGTGERIESLQASRSEEDTPWLRFQFIIFVLGLFHLKMACADAIWRIFIQPLKGRKDPHSLLEHVALLRPKETGKIGSKPGFRRMHEVIQHVGIVTRLECWRKALHAENASWSSLDECIKANPTWEMLSRVANRLAVEEVAGFNFDELRRQSPERRDKERENLLLRQQYFLLYEELSYAMNAGDIGRVETCFMPWVFIFRGCGKHKYASHMMRYLYNVHFVYPPGLRRAIRMNILCNPTGKKGHFRAIDWLVEHNNLFIKRIFGGSFSNHLKAYILKESALIGVYKSIRQQFQRLFCLDHQTYRHSPPVMKRTFDVLRKYMVAHNAVETLPGRDVKYSIPNMLSIGLHALQTMKSAVLDHDGGEGEGEGEGDDVEGGIAPNEEQEVEDDGDLDV